MVIRRSMRSNTKAARLLGEQVGPPPPGTGIPASCPLCGRPMVPGPSIDEHHLLPRSRGGKDKHVIHKVCHRKIHQTFSEKELARGYASWEALAAHPEIATFIAWVRKRPPEFL
jgi:hypothetical protein